MLCLWITANVFLFFVFTGVEGISVLEGETVALKCQHSGNKTFWKEEASQTYLHNLTAAEQRRRGLLLHGKHLVILRASENHQGIYSCSPREDNWPSRFMLNVFREHHEETRYSKKCFTQEACNLYCPESNVPPKSALNLTSIIWHKPDGVRERSPVIYISSVKETDGGVYTCFRSYRYHHQLYNMTFQFSVKVHPKERKKHVKIIKPKDKEVFYVDINAPKVIDCKTVDYLAFDDLNWLDVEQNERLPVFYNVTRDELEKKMTASLVFREVSEQDLTKTYTCRLESSHFSSNVSITLRRKARPSYISLAACSVFMVGVAVVTVVVYMKFKVDIVLFMRDTLGCRRSLSDGKRYDVFLMSYKSDTEELNGLNRKMLGSVLAERFGYSLCLFDRDVLPGESISEAVLDCVEQSRTVVLLPASQDPGLESSLLIALHAAFVERRTHLVFITTKKTGLLSTGSMPEALQLLSEAGDHVTWKDGSSLTPSSAFWKQLRYHLPATNRSPKFKLLPQTTEDVSV